MYMCGIDIDIPSQKITTIRFFGILLGFKKTTIRYTRHDRNGKCLFYLVNSIVVDIIRLYFEMQERESLEE